MEKPNRREGTGRGPWTRAGGRRRVRGCAVERQAPGPGGCHGAPPGFVVNSALPASLRPSLQPRVPGQARPGVRSGGSGPRRRAERWVGGGGGTAGGRGGAGRAGRGQCRVWATWGRAPRKRARRPISYQSPAAPCVSVNKTNPFGGVTFAKNAALFRLKGKYVFQIWFLWLD